MGKLSHGAARTPQTQPPAHPVSPPHLASSTEQRSCRRPPWLPRTSTRRWISPCTSSSGSTSLRLTQPL